MPFPHTSKTLSLVCLDDFFAYVMWFGRIAADFSQNRVPGPTEWVGKVGGGGIITPPPPNIFANTKENRNGECITIQPTQIFGPSTLYALQVIFFDFLSHVGTFEVPYSCKISSQFMCV